VDARTNADWYHRQVGPFLDETEASLLLGLDGSQIRELIARKEMIALLWEGRLVFPQWQFGSDGLPLAIIGKVIRVFGDSGTMFQIAAWFKTPQPFLEDIPPMRWIELNMSEESVLSAAAKRAELLRAHPELARS
jgi:hypothetical protein